MFRSGEDRVTLGRVRPTGVGRVTLGRVLGEMIWRDVSLASTVWCPLVEPPHTSWCREEPSAVMWQEEVVG